MSRHGRTGAAAAAAAHVVSFSGGLGSWYAARRVRDEHGVGAMTLLHTDAGTEDQETYAFLIGGAADVLGAVRPRVSDLAARALALPGVEEEERHDERRELLAALARDAEERLPGLVWTTQGKDVFDVYHDERFLGNSRVDPCSRVLKREASRRWVVERFSPEQVVIYVGIDHTERHRHEQIAGRWAPYQVVSPLCDEPLGADPKAAQIRACEDAGMNVPRLYRLGFSHGNCSGFCVKAGKGHFALLLRTMPARYRHFERKEQGIREYLGKDVTILREQRDGVRYRITLRELRERIEADGGPMPGRTAGRETGQEGRSGR